MPAPATVAVNDCQKRSLAELPQRKKWAIYEDGYGMLQALKGLEIYHAVSCKPITKAAEDDMEILSDIFGEEWGEQYLNHWLEGLYNCSRCSTTLFHSEDKWKGPCVWPSFRKPASGNIKTILSMQCSVDLVEVYPYNAYTVTVKEVYCKTCDLFIGHGFEDGIAMGDTSPDATGWRY